VPAILRIAAGAFVLGSPLFLPSPLYLLALPLAWVAILRPTGDEENPADPTARLLLAALAVMASLEAYPVAGTQLWIAAVAVLPVGVVIFNDGLRQLLSWATARQSRSLMNVAGWLAPALVIVNVQVALLFGYLAASAYASGQSPGLPGTDLMRLPPAQASTLRSLAYEIDQDCANLLTMPGMPSINLWSERERISELDLGTWVFLLDASQQELVVGQIRAMPGLCVVRNHAVLDFWARGRPIPRRPLVEFIDTAFATTAIFGDYELLIRKPG
jgi:hypothetical protein